MILNGGGPHTVIVTPMVPEKTRFNTWKKVPGTPVPVKGVTVQPFGGGTAGNLETNDDQVNDQWTVRGRGSWPGGVHSTVEYEGQVYDQVGVAKIHSIGQFTKHFQVRIAARGAEVK